MAGVVNTIYTASLYRLSRLFLRSNDVERLKQLLAEYPALLSWKDDEDGSLLGMATGAYGTLATRSENGGSLAAPAQSC